MASVIRINTATQDTIETELVTDEDIRKDSKQTNLAQQAGKWQAYFIKSLVVWVYYY